MFLHSERSLRAWACSAMRVLQQDNVYVSLKLKLAVAIASYRQSIARFLLESIYTELNYGIKLMREIMVDSQAVTVARRNYYRKQNVKNLCFCFWFPTTPRYNHYQAVFFNFRKIGLGPRL